MGWAADRLYNGRNNDAKADDVKPIAYPAAVAVWAVDDTAAACGFGLSAAEQWKTDTQHHC